MKINNAKVWKYLLLSITLFLTSCGGRSYSEKEIEAIKKQNRLNCEKHLAKAYSGIIDTIRLNSDFEYQIIFESGIIVSLYAVEHAVDYLNKGDTIVKEEGSFALKVGPISNDEPFVLSGKEGFNCSYWDSLKALDKRKLESIN